MNQDNNETPQEITTFKSKSEIAAEYNINSSTLYHWLKRIGFYEKFPRSKNNQLLRPIEQKYIIDKLGEA